MSTLKTNDRLFVPLIATLSVVVPGLVAVLLFSKLGGEPLVGDVGFLPAMNAGINTAVTILLLLGLYFVRSGNIKAHKTTMVPEWIFFAIFVWLLFWIAVEVPAIGLVILTRAGGRTIKRVAIPAPCRRESRT